MSERGQCLLNYGNKPALEKVKWFSIHSWVPQQLIYMCVPKMTNTDELGVKFVSERMPILYINTLIQNRI